MSLKFESPSAQYLRELEEVARDAFELNELITKANRLPDSFPTEAISVLCLGLIALPNGTAQGSIGILSHSHSRLPSWRNKYLEFSGGPLEHNNSDKIDPVARRGERLDNQIKSLYASVGSAIERYKLDTGNEVEIDLEPESDFSESAEIGRKASLNAIEAMGNASTGLRKQLEALTSYDQKAVDVPKRILIDVEN